jgi:hypothetical protein
VKKSVSLFTPIANSARLAGIGGRTDFLSNGLSDQSLGW